MPNAGTGYGWCRPREVAHAQQRIKGDLRASDWHAVRISPWTGVSVASDSIPQLSQMPRPRSLNFGVRVYNHKHDAATAHYGNNEVGARRANRQARIAKGIRSGQLSAGKTAKLEHRESNINHEVHNDRAANGGKLTPGEHAQVNRQLNRESARIYNKKHN
jgi:hypothetical protein